MNRREYERYHLELPTQISVLSENSNGRLLYLLTHDVCSKGAYFNAPCTFPLGTKVKLGLKLPPKVSSDRGFNSGHVEVTGQVVRCSGSGMAISFNSDYHFSSKPVDF